MQKLNNQICIINQTDPLGTNIEGIRTFLKGFIKYAPEDFYIDLIGISSNHKERPIKNRQD